MSSLVGRAPLALACAIGLALGAVLVGSLSTSVLAANHGSSTGASPYAPVQVANCPGCGGGPIVTIDVEVSGVPAYYNGEYPVSVPINLAFTSGSGVQSVFEPVSVASGTQILEGNAGVSFLASYNTEECDLTNPNTGCFSLQSAVDSSNNVGYFDHGTIPDYPYYETLGQSGWTYHFIEDCSGAPSGLIDLGGGSSLTTSIDLQYTDCAGYNYGYSAGDGFVDLNDSNNSTGPWNDTPAWFENPADVNITDDEDDSAVYSNGTACTVCVTTENDLIPLAGNATTVLSGGGIELNTKIPVLAGTYSWDLNITGWHADPFTGSFTVHAGRNATLKGTLEQTYPVTVVEAGLPTSSAWNVTFSKGALKDRTEIVDSDQTSFVAWLPNGTYHLDAASANYTFHPPVAHSPFTVNGTGVSVPVNFTGAATYAVAVSGSGLPSGYPFQINWSSTAVGERTVGGEAGASGLAAVLELANGTYSVSADVGSWYDATPLTQSVVVAGANGSVGFSFAAVPTSGLTVSEVGLPAGEMWGLSVGVPAQTWTSTASFIAIVVTDGIYTNEFCGGTVSVTPPPGLALEEVVAPCGGFHSSVSFRFASVEMLTVQGTFGEIYWPYLDWAVQVSPSSGYLPIEGSQATNQSSFVFFVPEGKYTVVASAPPVYKLSPEQGRVSVGASGALRTIKFKFVTAKEVFLEKDLAKGTGWGVNVTGPMDFNYVSYGGKLTFALENGTYAFTVWAAPGYTPVPATGTFTVVTTAGTHSISITFGR